MEQEDLVMATSMAESKRAIEAILLVSAEPTPSQLLAQLLELPVETIEEQCCELAMAYDLANHGFQLVKVAGGWRYQTHPDLAPYVERFAMDGQSTRLSTAALETLAIVAYKQPMSRAQVSAIRGVNVDAVLRTLVQRGYVEEVGRDVGAGQAVLFGTTQYFLERVGLDVTSDLPSLGDFVPSAEVVEALEQTLKLDPDPEHSDTEGESDDTVDPAVDAEADPVAAVEPHDTAPADPAAATEGADFVSDPVQQLDDRDAEIVDREPEPAAEDLGVAEVTSEVDRRSGVIVVETPSAGPDAADADREERSAGHVVEPTDESMRAELDDHVVQPTGRELDDH